MTEVHLTVTVATTARHVSPTEAENMASWLNDLILENAPFEVEWALVKVEEVESG